MARNYYRILFGDTARAMQARFGSRDHYARAEEAEGVDPLTEKELGFIAARDSFYMASVTADGWPYVQHRGGPPGFLRPLGGNRLGFADYRGNKQYVSAGNLADNARVALFLMDYPARRRLKLIGTATSIECDDDPALVTALMPDGYKAAPERAFVIDVAGLDWNCSQHITPRFTEVDMMAAIRPMAAELNQLRARLGVEPPRAPDPASTPRSGE
ncbi:MAG: pyridoxamine 5'-phosphate oxidase family protein [Sphingopyxis sp.]|uniref:pyridoxamine 5'-phosphate oxidase family protein n=1 Tax=Sphingopyxis sp. TaxID=1908224 RepID=UPI002ABB7E7A|nr:pyridoxamine 5'-phosphate oxidase family protein [Sphingopyxis sp.]MDZ3830753.1 pyridoxamine 5'-phosphate oxidase family protein [Sphingopyxis sp.]